MSMEKTATKDKKEMFVDWLIGRYKPVTVNNIFMAVITADEFLEAKSLSKKSVFSLDPLQAHSLLSSLQGNKVFHFQHRQESTILQKASGELRAFLQAHPQPITSTISNELVEQPKQIEKDKLTKQTLPNKIANTSVDEFLIDYAHINSYTYAIPISITYFGDVFPVSNWMMTYVKACTYLYEDYLNVFQNLIEHPIIGTQRDFAKTDSHYGMTRPIEFFPGVWVETDLSIMDMVKRIALWLDRCNVDYENLTIRYIERRSLEGSDNITKDLKVLTSAKAWKETAHIVIAKEAFENWMIQIAGLARRSAQSYSSAVKVAGEYVVEFCIDTKPLYCMSESVRIQNCIDSLFKYAAFVKINKSQHNRYRVALGKYIEHCRAGSAGSPPLSMESDDLSEKKKNQYAVIIANDFPNGFRANAIYWARTRKYFAERYADCTESNEEITRYMEAVGVWRDGILFNVTDNKQNPLLEEIKQAVVDVLASRASCVYTESLFGRYHIRLANELHIYTENAMTEAVCAVSGGEYIKRYNYFLRHSGEANTTKDIMEYLREVACPQTYDELGEALWFIPIVVLKRIMTTTPKIVRTAEGVYMFAPAFPVSAIELRDIIELIHRELSIKKYLLDTRLRKLVEEELPAVAINTESYSLIGWRNALGYLLKEYFFFAGRIISNIGEPVDMAQVYRNFAMERSNFSLQELTDFSLELETGIYYDALYEVAIRVSETEFVNQEQIQFPVAEIDTVLDTFCREAYIAIKEVTIFLHFPLVGHCWNSYLLESYVNRFSKKYWLIHQNFTSQKCYGAIVKRTSSVIDYDALALDVLENSMQWSNKESALQLLVNEGYQARKSYSSIEVILQKAKLRREQKEQ